MKTKNQVPNERKEEIPEKELNEMEESKLPDTEFKTVFKWMLKELVRTSGKLVRTSTA